MIKEMVWASPQLTFLRIVMDIHEKPLMIPLEKRDGARHL